MQPIRKYLLYCLYALTALVVCLYLRFPSELVEQMLHDQLAKADPDIQLSTSQVALALPVGIALESPALAYAGMPLIRMDHCKVKPQLLSLLGQNKQGVISGRLGQGLLSGKIEHADDPARPQTVVALNLERTQLDYIDAVNQWPAFLVDGIMDAIVKYDSTKAGGTAEISATINPVKIALETPLMGIETLEFTSIDAQVTLTPRMLQIRNCNATGDQLESKITGSIVFRQPMPNSRLTLSVTVKPQPAFIADHKDDMIGGLLASDNAQKRGIVFRISGTIANPRYVIR